ncbi:hypothetical protein GCK72_019466 [Caenorhabditis remanei]|uniref:Serpentine Receptor, class H n=1 Tax=Caenorhabditis remanei TaxID=31234 RepID=A0A6A5GDZ9_CAERE|nr:hypothetical protein GCK72_019466 [Caenorhabditis remanei]KAF1752911.1 hypothetical protein GCK72_019466 [Caenorhabditis remanei]
MKQPLLVTHFWCAALDFSFGTLATPYIFYPHGALFQCGFLNIFEIPVIYLIIPGLLVILSMAISLIYLFESRSSSIINNRFRIKRTRTRVIYYVLNYLLYSPIVLILYNIPENQEAAKLEITTVQIVFFVVCSVHYLYVKPVFMSPLTRRYQIHFFIGIVIQAVLPLFVIVLTYAISIVAILMNRLTQSIVNMCIVTVSVHGLVESLAIISIHAPYRAAVKSLFGKLKYRRDNRVTSEESGVQNIISLSIHLNLVVEN